MKISVVIPCYNAADHLANTVASVVKQGVADTEIIVVDDKSSDDTLQVAERLSRTTPHVRIIKLPVNGGPAKARNAGLHQATGEYVCFLDADDAYGDKVFASVISTFDANPWLDALDFAITLVNDHRGLSAYHKRIFENCIPSNIIVRRSLALAVGGFAEEPAFRTELAGEDTAFRAAVREWGVGCRLDGVFLHYLVRQGSHYDEFVNVMEKPETKDERVEILVRAQLMHLKKVRQSMRERAGVGKTRMLPCSLGDRKFDFEVTDNGEAHKHATETLTGKTYPFIPFLGTVERVLDIGANVGASAVFFALHYANARVVAIEPARQPFVLLNENAKKFSNIRVFNVGLSNVTERNSIYRGAIDSVTNSLTHHLWSSNEKEEVQLVAAGGFTKLFGMDHSDIIKIDTEGCELPIINSMIESVRNAKAIYVEYHSEEDRLELDRILCPTHLLFYGKISTPHRGELAYVRKDVFPSVEERDRWKIAATG
jgi:FkbM family methyltransferase